MQYDFSFESPLKYVRRFFESAFGLSKLNPPESGLIAHWSNFTERFIKNTIIFPLSRRYHPVYIAAGYLAFSKSYLESQGEKQSQLPDVIAGHPWYLFVDPAIEAAHLQSVVETIKEEWQFFNQHLTQQANQQ